MCKYIYLNDCAKNVGPERSLYSANGSGPSSTPISRGSVLFVPRNENVRKLSLAPPSTSTLSTSRVERAY